MNRKKYCIIDDEGGMLRTVRKTGKRIMIRRPVFMYENGLTTLCFFTESQARKFIKEYKQYKWTKEHYNSSGHLKRMKLRMVDY